MAGLWVYHGIYHSLPWFTMVYHIHPSLYPGPARRIVPVELHGPCFRPIRWLEEPTIHLRHETTVHGER